MKKQIRSYTPCVFYTLAMVSSMLWNAHGTSYRPALLNTHTTDNRNTITTVQQNDTAQNSVPQDIYPDNTDNLFDTKRIITNTPSEKKGPGLNKVEKISLGGLGVSVAVGGLSNHKLISELSAGKKTAGILGIAALASAGAATATQKKRARKACAAHIIDQLRQHNFSGQLWFDKVDAKLSSDGIQCAYYNTISNDDNVDNKVFNFYKNLSNPSVPEKVSLFRKYCTERKKGQCDTSQTVCLDMC